MRYIIYETEEYEEWFIDQPLKNQTIIDKRVKNIIKEGYFGDRKNVSEYDKGITKDKIHELRWDDGKRVYFGELKTDQILLLYGGNKNGQTKDINKAKKIFTEYVEA